MEMTESEKKFAVAALAVFQRFGVRKATMEEIAQEAGVSKPTLYATFRNKDAALAGAIRFAKAQALASVVAAWATSPGLGQKLDVFFEILIVAGFDMLHSSPDAKMFETALGNASQDAIVETQDADIQAFRQELEISGWHKDAVLSAAAFAEFVISSAMNAKRQSQDRDALLAYLEQLKVVALTVALDA